MRVWAAEHNSIFQTLPFERAPFDDADAILLWNDVQPEARAIVNLARAKKKRVYVLQHGRKGSSKYYPPFNEKIYADKLLVWGEFDCQRLIESGQDRQRIEVVGSPVFSRLIGRLPHDGINVVFCPEHWDVPITENQQVKKLLRKLKGVNVVTKIIESHDPKDFDNTVQTNRNDPDHLDVCAKVLATADVVVGVSESTFELMAQALDIPVVIMQEWEPKSFGGDIRYQTYQRLISNASKKSLLKDLNETIMQQLSNPHELHAERMAVRESEGGFSFDFNGRLAEVCRT